MIQSLNWEFGCKNFTLHHGLFATSNQMLKINFPFIRQMASRNARFICSSFAAIFSFLLTSRIVCNWAQSIHRKLQQSFKMGLFSTFYNNVLRRSSTYALAIVTGAFFFERGFDMASENLYNEINRGVLVTILNLSNTVLIIFITSRNSGKISNRTMLLLRKNEVQNALLKEI